MWFFHSFSFYALCVDCDSRYIRSIPLYAINTLNCRCAHATLLCQEEEYSHSSRQTWFDFWRIRYSSYGCASLLFLAAERPLDLFFLQPMIYFCYSFLVVDWASTMGPGKPVMPSYSWEAWMLPYGGRLSLHPQAYVFNYHTKPSCHAFLVCPLGAWTRALLLHLSMRICCCLFSFVRPG